MKPPIVVATIIAILCLPVAAASQPTTMSGDPFKLVAISSYPSIELYELASDASGNVYAGNNSNTTLGIPVQEFVRASYFSAAISLVDFGPSVGDADGIWISGSLLYVPDRDEGLRVTTIPSGPSFIHIPDAAISAVGDPVVVSGSNVFLGLGGGGIDEYAPNGSFVLHHPTASDVETMTLGPGGKIYYAPYQTGGTSEVRVLDPSNNSDVLVGTIPGTIDGGLCYDALSGQLFIGTANGTNSGNVYTMSLAGVTTLFAIGFNGSLGLLREPVTGDLYFLESDRLWRLESQFVAPKPGVKAADWLHDAFPFNDLPGLAGTPQFDSTTALVKTGRNTAQLTGDSQRLDIPGDSLVACACGHGLRLDLVFRILPGPGNYKSAGGRTNPPTASMHLLKVPTDPTTVVVPGDASFWGQYLANNGEVGSPEGHHAGQWDPNVWNSARMDTAEVNLWPISSRNDMPQMDPCIWASTYHEADPKFIALGIAKNRCFLTTPTAAINSSGITCDLSATNGWPLNAGYAAESGLPLGQTREYTKIIPDGLLTPGSHVEYFIRSSTVGSVPSFAMTPDTNRVTPQLGELQDPNSDCTAISDPGSTDAHRWQEFSVLPDRWKDPSFGGLMNACMLYVDLDDGDGDERIWNTAAELIGATLPAKYGAHNGWHVSSLTMDPNDPANFVRPHIGQAGTRWDMYGVRGTNDPLNGYAGSLGSRLGPVPPINSPAFGKQARIGPTAEMLSRYYRVLFITAGRLDAGILGPFDDRGQDDVAMLNAFRASSIGGNPRGCLLEGGSFAQAEHAAATAGYPQHDALVSDLFGATISSNSYAAIDASPCPDVITTAITDPGAPGAPFGVENDHLPPNDVLLIDSSKPTSAVADAYAVAGSTVSTVIQPFGVTYWTGLLNAWDIQDFHAQFCTIGSAGLVEYLTNVFSSLLDIACISGTDVGLPVPGTGLSFDVFSNPVRDGRARIELVTPRAGQVVVSIHDVAGRTIRTLTSRSREPGGFELSWDGRDTNGNAVRSGVYFVRASLAGGGPAAARSLIWLR